MPEQAVTVHTAIRAAGMFTPDRAKDVLMSIPAEGELEGIRIAVDGLRGSKIDLSVQDLLSLVIDRLIEIRENGLLPILQYGMPTRVRQIEYGRVRQS